MLCIAAWTMPNGHFPDWDDLRTQISAQTNLPLWQAASWKSTTPPTEATTESAAASRQGKEIVRVASPSGGYVDEPVQKVAVAASTSITRVGSPTGRYVKGVQKTAAKMEASVTQIGSPAGRYVEATTEKTKVAAAGLVRIGSPAGRYVSETTPIATQPTEAVTSITRVSSPAGRYVDAATPTTDTTKTETQIEVARISSPDGRYVDAPAVTPKQPTESMANITRVSSPAGRYVDAPTKTTTAAASTNKDVIVFPIKFRTAKNTFTTSGKKAAGQLLEYVLKNQFTTITLTGHTDERGEPNDNLALSERRLLAVADHLREGGYRFQILLEPKGESQPFDKVDRSKYEEKELWELDRRVELRDAR